MPSKFATDSFQTFAQNEIGYVPSSPKCKDCLHFDLQDDGFGGCDDTCNILGPLGLMNINPEGCCRYHEPKRVGCVPVFSKEPTA